MFIYVCLKISSINAANTALYFVHNSDNCIDMNGKYITSMCMCIRVGRDYEEFHSYLF